jgi:hypothetical protein
VPNLDRLQIVRDCYSAYESRDRHLIEQHLAEDFTFYSPADVRIDRARHFERCWPNAGLFKTFEFKRLAGIGDEVVVTYESTKTDGSRFGSTEVFTLDSDQIRQVEVDFGWDLK